MDTNSVTYPNTQSQATSTSFEEKINVSSDTITKSAENIDIYDFDGTEYDVKVKPQILDKNSQTQTVDKPTKSAEIFDEYDFDGDAYDVTDCNENVSQASANIDCTLDLPEKWTTSAIDTELALLNCEVLDYANTAAFLWGDDHEPKRTNTGRLSGKDWFFSDGAMLWRPVNPETGIRSEWGLCKPFPVLNHWGKKTKGKPLSPKGAASYPFVFDVPQQIWDKIADRYNLPRATGNFWEWVRANKEIPLVLAEGPEKAASLLSAGDCAVGFNGIYSINESSKDLTGYQKPLHHWVRWILGKANKKKMTGRAVIIAYDADENPAATQKATGILAGKLSKLGHPVWVASWDKALGKGIDDVAYAHGTDKVEEILEAALPYKLWLWVKEQKLSHPDFYCDANKYMGITERTITTTTEKQRVAVKDLLSNTDKYEYIDVPTEHEKIRVSLPKSGKKINCLVARKGGGKSTIFSSKVGDAMESAISNGGQVVIPIVSLGHRIRLQKELADKFGLVFINDITERYEWTQSRYEGMVVVIDSLHPGSRTRIDFIDDLGLMKNCLLIIDECEQVFHHLATSTTLNGKRASVSEQLKELMERASEIWLADADLSDVSIEYVLALTGLGKNDVAIYRNTYQREDTYSLNLVLGQDSNGIKDNPLGAICKAIQLLKSGKKVMLFTAAQKAQSTFSAQNLAKLFEPIVKELGGFIEVRDSEKKDESFDLNNVPDDCLLLIATPVIETGVSITEKHFDAVVAISHGIQSVQAFCQSLDRIRYPVPHYIWVPKISSHKQLGSASTLPQAKKYLTTNISELKKQYPDWDIYGENDALQPLDLLKLKNIVISNLAADCYRDAVLYRVAQDGHTIDEEIIRIPDNYSDELGEIKDKNYDALVKAINALENPCDTRFKELQSKPTKTKEENLEYKRGKVERDFGYCDEEIIRASDDGAYSQLKLRYYLQASPSIRDNKARRDSTGKRETLPGEIADNAYAHKVDFLNILYEEISKVGDAPITKQHPIVQCCVELDDCKFAALLGRRLPKREIDRTKAVLEKFGMTLIRTGREKDGDRMWQYQLTDQWCHLNQEKIWEHWHGVDAEINARYLEKLSERMDDALAKVDGLISEIEGEENHLINARPNFENPCPNFFAAAETQTGQAIPARPNFPNNIIYTPPIPLPTKEGSAPAASPAAPSSSLNECGVEQALSDDEIETDMWCRFFDAIVHDCIPEIWQAIKAMGQEWAEKVFDDFSELIQEIDPVWAAKYAF